MFVYTRIGMAALQGSLFDADEEIGIRSLEAVERTDLSDGAWVDLLPGWVTGAGPLFEALVDVVPWKSERRKMYDRTVDVPRLLSFYGEYEPLPHPIFDHAKEALERALCQGNRRSVPLHGVLPRSRWERRRCLAWGHHRAGQHRRHVGGHHLAGARRRLLLRPKSGGPARRFEVGEGDLLVMGGSCQRTWQHTIPKTVRPVGPRISVQLRPRGVT